MKMDWGWVESGWNYARNEPEFYGWKIKGNGVTLRIRAEVPHRYLYERFPSYVRRMQEGEPVNNGPLDGVRSENFPWEAEKIVQGLVEAWNLVAGQSDR